MTPLLEPMMIMPSPPSTSQDRTPSLVRSSFASISSATPATGKMLETTTVAEMNLFITILYLRFKYGVIVPGCGPKMNSRNARRRSLVKGGSCTDKRALALLTRTAGRPDNAIVPSGPLDTREHSGMDSRRAAEDDDSS